MAKLLSSLEELYSTKDLYEVLNVPRKASPNEIKKAYYTVSLKVHPDRASEDEKEVATKRFQALSQVYSILSDKDKKALYDESGEIDEECDILQQDRNWESYWRLLFKKISVEDIKDYESKYRFSEEERVDVLAAYEECKGDMDLIIESVPCCTVEDDGRFKEIIDKAIAVGKVEKYEKHEKENKKKKSNRRKKVISILNCLFSSEALGRFLSWEPGPQLLGCQPVCMLSIAVLNKIS